MRLHKEEVKAFNLKHSHWLGQVSRWCLCVLDERHSGSVQLSADAHSFHTCADVVTVITDAVCVCVCVFICVRAHRRISVYVYQNIFRVGKPIGYKSHSLLDVLSSFSPHPSQT